MFLIIDNSGEKAVVFYYSTGASSGGFKQKQIKAEAGEDILVCLEKFLTQIGLTLKDIKYLAVVIGVGKFTATRLAVTCVNTLGLALKIPVMGIDKEWRPEAVWKKIKKIPVGQYAVPKYSGEAHIGKKKK
ncbi:MAG: hypothetical protein WC526_01955 [Patescibacteria group bacterium]